MNFPHGSMLKFDGDFYDDNGNLVNPDNVTLKIRLPSQVLETYVYPADIALLSTGKYHFERAGDQSGVWIREWSSTGAVQNPKKTSFIVDPPI